MENPACCYFPEEQLKTAQPSAILGRIPETQDWYYLMRATEQVTGLTGFGLSHTWAAIRAGAYDNAVEQLRHVIAKATRNQGQIDYAQMIQREMWLKWLVEADLPLALADTRAAPVDV